MTPKEYTQEYQAVVNDLQRNALKLERMGFIVEARDLHMLINYMLEAQRWSKEVRS